MMGSILDSCSRCGYNETLEELKKSEEETSKAFKEFLDAVEKMEADDGMG